jgi:hypothetical protein
MVRVNFLKKDTEMQDVFPHLLSVVCGLPAAMDK